MAGLHALRDLILGENLIADLRPLASLTNLSDLELGRNLISDPAPLGGLSQLLHLGLNGNLISDASPLQGLGTLMTLDLDDNLIQDDATFARLANLESLSVRVDRLTRADRIPGLPHLRTIIRQGNALGQLPSFSAHSQLQELYAGGNRLTNIQGVASLRFLTNLDLAVLVDSAASGRLQANAAVYLDANPLSPFARTNQIPTLQNHYGIRVLWQ